MYSRETINELNQLSKEIFGASSKWRKMVESGVLEPVMEDIKKVNPDGTFEMTKIQAMHTSTKGGEVPKSRIVRYTPETIKAYMVERKAQKEQFIAALAKMEQDKRAANAAEAAKKAALEHASGSSV
jgi:hypothetical protein